MVPATPAPGAGGSGPAHQLRNRATDRADQGRRRGLRLERRVDQHIEQDRAERQHRGHGVDLPPQQSATQAAGEQTPEQHPIGPPESSEREPSPPRSLPSSPTSGGI